MFAFIMALGVLALALLPKQFRKIGFIAAGVVALFFLTIVLIDRRPAPIPALVPGQKTPAAIVSRKFDFDQYERDKKDKEDPEAKSKITASALRFDQVQAIAGLESGTIQAVRARLYNDSRQATLTDYAYYLVIQDCLPVKMKDSVTDRCTTVYDQRGFVTLVVPASQARDVLIAIPKASNGFALPFKLLGTARLELTATDARAYQATTPKD